MNYIYVPQHREIEINENAKPTKRVNNPLESKQRDKDILAKIRNAKKDLNDDKNS